MYVCVSNLTISSQRHQLFDLTAPVESLLLLQGGLHGPVQDGRLDDLAKGLMEVAHADHLQRVPVHAPQVVQQAATGCWLHYIVGHPFPDLHGLEQVAHKQEFGQEVLTLRHGVFCNNGHRLGTRKNKEKVENEGQALARRPSYNTSAADPELAQQLPMHEYGPTLTHLQKGMSVTLTRDITLIINIR